MQVLLTLAQKSEMFFFSKTFQAQLLPLINFMQHAPNNRQNLHLKIYVTLSNDFGQSDEFSWVYIIFKLQVSFSLKCTYTPFN